MNIALEIKRKEAEILRVQAAKAEQAFKIEEALDQISRLEKAMKLQEDRVLELNKEIEKLKSQI